LSLEISSHDFSQSEKLVNRAYKQTINWIETGSLEKGILPKIIGFHEHAMEM
jgi:hypothetical protein